MIIDFNNITLERIKKNETLKFDFNNNTCHIISDKLSFNFSIKVLEKKVINNYFYVYYKIDDDFFKLEIKII